MGKTSTNNSNNNKNVKRKSTEAKHPTPGDLPAEHPTPGAPAAAGNAAGPGSSGKKNKPWLKIKSEGNMQLSKNARAVATYYFVEIIGLTLILLRKWSEKKATDSVFSKDPPHPEFVNDTGLATQIILNPVDTDGKKIKNEDGYPDRLLLYCLLGEENDLCTPEACAEYHRDDMCPALTVHHLIDENRCPTFGGMERVPFLGEFVSLTDVIKVIRNFFAKEPREYLKVPGNIYKFYRRGHLPHAVMTTMRLPRQVIDQADAERFWPTAATNEAAGGSADRDAANAVSQEDA